MPWVPDLYRSPGATQRRLDFERRRGWALDRFFPPLINALEALQPPGDRLQALQMQAFRGEELPGSFQAVPTPQRQYQQRVQQAFQMEPPAPEAIEVPGIGERQGPGRLQAALLQEGLAPADYLRVLQQADEGYRDYSAKRKEPPGWKPSDVKKAEAVTQRTYGQDIWQFVAGVRQERELKEFVQEQQKQVEAGTVTQEQAAASITAYAKEMGGNVKAMGLLPLGPASPETPGYGRGFKDILTPLIRTPSEQDLSFLGPAAGPVSRELHAATTPAFGIAATAAPLQAAVGSLGAVTAGTVASAAGAPPAVQYGAEIGGGLISAEQAAALGRTGRGVVTGAVERVRPRPPGVQPLMAHGAPLEMETAVRRGLPGAVEAAPEPTLPTMRPTEAVPEPAVPEPSAWGRPSLTPPGAAPVTERAWWAGIGDWRRGLPAFEARQNEVERITREMEEAYAHPWTGEPESLDAMYARDYVAEGLLRKTPTQRDVEAWSRRLPPEERAAMATEVADTRFPIDDYDTVLAREGARYQRNPFTWLDDQLQPLTGIDRNMQHQVRNARIGHDVYASRQGARMEFAVLEWVARYKDVLDLKTWGFSRGYARGVPVREGAKIPRKLVQRLDHITEHPEKYTITSEQAEALRARQDYFGNLSHAEQRHGVDVLPIEEGYSPRIITRTPRGDPLNIGKLPKGPAYPSTHPFYTQERRIKDIEQLYAAGYETADPITAMGIRGRLGAETIANAQFIRQIQGLGVKPTELVDESLKAELATARKTFQAARKAYVKSGSVADRAALEQAQASLNDIRADVRQAHRLAKQQRVQVFGRTVAPDIAEELERYLGRLDESQLDDAFRVMRTTLINADYGSLLLQTWNTLWRNPVGWFVGAVRGMRSIADAPWDYILRNSAEIDVAIRYGHVIRPEEFLLARGGRPAQLLGQLPVIKQSQRIFEWDIFVAQVERSKAVQGLAKTDDDLLELGAVLRKQSGTNFMPGITKRQAWLMGKAWFAPQFTTAMHAALADPFIRTGVARREAIRGMGQAFGGAALATVAINKFVNGEWPNMTDPDKPGFWGIRWGKSYAYPFGPYQPFIVAATRSARAAAALAKGETPSKRDLQAWPAFMANKASIPVRYLMRVADAMGLPLEDVRGPAFGRPEFRYEEESPLEAVKRGALEIAPIGPKQAFEGWKKGEWMPMLELLGGRTTVSSASQQLRQAFERKARLGAFGPEIQAAPEYGTRPSDRALAESDAELAELLKRADEAALGRGAPYALERERVRERLAEVEEHLELESRAEEYLAGETTGEGFMSAYQEFSGTAADLWAYQYFDADFEESDDPVAIDYRALRDLNPNAPEFRDPETGEVDWDLFYDAYYPALEKLPEEVQEALEKRSWLTGEKAKEVEVQVKRAKELNRELHDISPIHYLTMDDYEEIQQFAADVKRDRIRTIQDDPRYQQVGFNDWARWYGEEKSVDPNTVDWAIELQGEVPDDWRNPRYIAFLRKHEDELKPFYPYIYEKVWVARLLGGG